MNAHAARRALRWVQVLLAFPFLAMGGWCLLAPGTVERLSFRPEFVADSPASHVLVGCFGAQAVLCGVLVLVCRFSRRAFLVFGVLGSLPFFAFNYYFVAVEPIFTSLMALDFAGNLLILVLGLAGAALTEPGP